MFQQQLAFIGLGVMGAPMATNLVKAGYRLSVHDLDQTKAQPLVALGAEWADSIATAVTSADVVMTSLPGPTQVRDVALADDGVLANLAADKTWIELSTNNLTVCREVVAAAGKKGIRWLDAPISGGSEGSQAGTLTVLVGGQEAVFSDCLPIFEVIGERIEHLGEAGAGYAAKIAQVVLCYVHSLALSEALMLGVKGGVDPDKMLDIIRNSTATSYVAEHYGPPILNGDYDPSFKLGLALKDMGLSGFRKGI